MAPDLRWPRLAAAFSRLSLPVAVVDLESTGGNLYEDRVTEVAVLRFENQTVSRHQWLLNPQQPISDFIAKLTGIDNEMVAAAPTFADIAAELLPLLRGCIIVAHNSRFDYTFLSHEFQRVGMAFAAPALCTVQLSRRLYPQFYKHNLDSLIERSGLAIENRHRAMADVEALCGFLEHSLGEHQEDYWLAQCRALLQPQALPDWLPQPLLAELYALPDSNGVSVWADASGTVTAVLAHERAYRETAALLNGKQPPAYARQAVSVHFEPAVGALHALWLKAQIMQHHKLRPSESLRTFSTVKFRANEHGVLQARVSAMHNGRHTEQPHGFFLHKKAAKRALNDWAQSHSLCPASLDILPGTHAHGAGCPVHSIGGCNGTCRSAEGIERQNELIRRHAHLLPVADWGKARRLEITETEPLSGISHTFICAGGALALPDGSWYFDEHLPPLLKSKFKQGKESVRVLD